MKIKIFIFAIVLLLVSCSEFLEPKSPNEYIPEQASALDEMLLGSAYPSSTSDPLFVFHNILDDDVKITDENVTWSEVNVNQREAFMQLFSWHPDLQMTMKDAGNYQKVWETYYNLILGANILKKFLEQKRIKLTCRLRRWH